MAEGRHHMSLQEGTWKEEPPESLKATLCTSRLPEKSEVYRQCVDSAHIQQRSSGGPGVRARSHFRAWIARFNQCRRI